MKRTLCLPIFEGKLVDFYELDFHKDFDGLLGFPALKSLNASIDCAGGTIKLNGRLIHTLNRGNKRSEIIKDNKSIISEENKEVNRTNVISTNNVRPDFITETDKPINCFYNQFVFITGDKKKISQNTIFKSKRLTIMHPEFTDDILTRII